MRKSTGFSKMQILNAYQLNELGYDPNVITGLFLFDRRPLEIVGRYPNLHIISCTEDTYLNYYAPGHRHYFVSAGDPDPTIEILDEAFNEESYQMLEHALKDENGEITDPVAKAGLKFIRGFVSDKTPWQLERERKAREGEVRQPRVNESIPAKEFVPLTRRILKH